MGADERSRVARIAASRGWLKHWVSVCDSEEIGFSSMTDDQIKSYGWVVEGESLKSVRARIAKMIVANKKLESIKSTAKKALINLLDEAQALSFEDRLWVPHEAYAARETECTADGESEYMRVEQFHVDKFFGEVKLMISKIEALESHDKHFIARENPD